jgi:hypothetical protein
LAHNALKRQAQLVGIVGQPPQRMRAKTIKHSTAVVNVGWKYAIEHFGALSGEPHDCFAGIGCVGNALD